ncbi:hypothetical protein PR048_019401 [Dryococelus australis]|uniref:Uncharacterized protein n=1 Tax=Dryococelus australis TaxID=614101 RepID=A0ABQ9H3G1_9NEOP|nr:hypothetical protein PR048_019401 [Dryococelus australis]
MLPAEFLTHAQVWAGLRTLATAMAQFAQSPVGFLHQHKGIRRASVDKFSACSSFTARTCRALSSPKRIWDPEIVTAIGAETSGGEFASLRQPKRPRGHEQDDRAMLVDAIGTPEDGWRSEVIWCLLSFQNDVMFFACKAAVFEPQTYGKPTFVPTTSRPFYHPTPAQEQQSQPLHPSVSQSGTSTD